MKCAYTVSTLPPLRLVHAVQDVEDDDQRAEITELIEEVAGRIHRDVAVFQARRHEPRAEVQDEQLEHPRGDLGDALLRADLEVQERKAHALDQGRAREDRAELVARVLAPHDEPDQRGRHVAEPCRRLQPSLVGTLHAAAAEEFSNEVNPIRNRHHRSS